MVSAIQHKNNSDCVTVKNKPRTSACEADVIATKLLNQLILLQGGRTAKAR